MGKFYCAIMLSEQLKQVLIQAFPNATIEVMTDDEVHFTLRMQDASMNGKLPLERHRLVHRAIGPQLIKSIHALSMELTGTESADE
jgi:acid stress-induced BolA-like protein IbaG/YrbA